MDVECHRFALPLMLGYVGIRSVMVNGVSFKLALVSRRSWQRAGTRFHTRGVDREGAAANFIETEQVVEAGSVLCSYVQFRGSIPLYWSQKPNLKWQPMPVLRGDDQLSGFKLHLTHLQAVYPGLVVLVNLVNSKGREAAMARALAGVVQAAALPNVAYQYFDFHKVPSSLPVPSLHSSVQVQECKALSWEKGLAKLAGELASHKASFTYFSSDAANASKEPQLQSGFFRTNCMDSLDRTNVVQALIAKAVLRAQLADLNILPLNSDPAHQPVFEQTFKHRSHLLLLAYPLSWMPWYAAVWADNADACSVQYAGTGALKTDFTR